MSMKYGVPETVKKYKEMFMKKKCTENTGTYITDNIGIIIAIVSLIISIFSMVYANLNSEKDRVTEVYTEAIVSLEKLSLYYTIGEQTGDYTLSNYSQSIDDQWVFDYLEECVEIKASLDVLDKNNYADEYWCIISDFFSKKHLYDGKRVEQLKNSFNKELH